MGGTFAKSALKSAKSAADEVVDEHALSGNKNIFHQAPFGFCSLLLGDTRFRVARLLAKLARCTARSINLLDGGGAFMESFGRNGGGQNTTCKEQANGIEIDVTELKVPAKEFFGRFGKIGIGTGSDAEMEFALMVLTSRLMGEDIANRQVGRRINGDTNLLSVMEIHNVDTGFVNAAMDGGLRRPHGVCKLRVSHGADKALEADEIPAGCRNIETLNGLRGPRSVNVLKTKGNSSGLAACNADTGDPTERNGIWKILKRGEE